MKFHFSEIESQLLKTNTQVKQQQERLVFLHVNTSVGQYIFIHFTSVMVKDECQCHFVNVNLYNALSHKVPLMCSRAVKLDRTEMCVIS